MGSYLDLSRKYFTEATPKKRETPTFESLKRCSPGRLFFFAQKGGRGASGAPYAKGAKGALRPANFSPSSERWALLLNDFSISDL